jgi:hypothetical protein
MCFIFTIGSHGRPVYNFATNSGETMGGRVQNLKPWPKGISGNPAGRPKCDLSSVIARAVFENNPDAIYQAMLRGLAKGNARIFVVLADRAYGKVEHQIEADILENVVEKLAAGRRRVLNGLSESEIVSRIAVLEKQLGYVRDSSLKSHHASLSVSKPKNAEL